ncbi:MAG: hypothetical protein NTX91_03595 [candidate division SR1 bacterium]|nr:hypothetical protein [candidate division SR1 bacterium]
MDITQIQSLQNQLAPYHGALLLANIAELEKNDLLAVLGSGYEHLTVTKARKTLLDNLSAESIILQMGKFQAALKNKTITRGAGRLDENKRKELFKDYKLYELLELAFSPAIHYFTIPDEAFKANKGKERALYLNAIDAMIIDPSTVPLSSLETLGIKQLDPDCQNLKEVFKKMVSLKYINGDKTVYTPTINTYAGKFITFSSHSVVFPVEGNATQGETRKEDIRTQMAVYPNLFSMLRREGHILDGVTQKKAEYQDIKKELIAMINEIDRSQKCYGASVPFQVQGIIMDIDNATNAKVVAQKIYKLYKVHGNNNVTDKKLLESAITGFTKRIGQLIGISAHVQLHALALEDELEDQQSDIESFHAQAKHALLEDEHMTVGSYSKLLFAFENYAKHHAKYLKEPFLSFDKQIARIFGTITDIKRQDPETFAQKANFVVSLQRQFLDAYILEHKYKEGLVSAQELAIHFATPSDDYLSSRYPVLYKQLFDDIDAQHKQFSSEFSYDEITQFFAELKDIDWLGTKLATLQEEIPSR